MDYKAKAMAALEKRSALITSTEAAGRVLTAGEVRQVDDWEDDARVYIERDEARQAVPELRQKAARLGVHLSPQEGAEQGSADEWRSGIIPSLTEMRATSTTSTDAAVVPLAVSQTFIDRLRGVSSFLAPEAGVQVVRWADGHDFRIPVLAAGGGTAFVAEGVDFPETTQTVSSLTFTSIKLGGVRPVSYELLSDSAVDLRQMVDQTLRRDLAQGIDQGAFTGAGGATALTGITKAGVGTLTTLSAGKVTVSWDDVLTAQIAIIGSGGNPTVVWCSADMYAGLLQSKASTAGSYLGGAPNDSRIQSAWGVPLLVASSLPAKTVVVADGSRVYLGIRDDIAVSYDLSQGFTKDVVYFKVRARVGGVGVAEATSVQVIKAAAV